MRSSVIVFFIGLGTTLLMLVFRQAAMFASAHGRYYFTVFLLIGIFIAAIGISRLIRHAIGRNDATPARTQPDSVSDASLSHPRNAYRVHYDNTAPRPVFVEKSDVPEAAPTFTCPVADVSETGLSLECEGIYPKGGLVQGEIIFGSGRTAPVNGVVIREQNGRTALKLDCLIDPSLLMIEQREQILHHKDDDSLPVVNPLAKPHPPHPLPGHQPKGICRTDPS